MLYGAHLALVLFWLIDPSQNAWRTRLLLAFLRDLFKLILPILWLPPVSQALSQLAEIIGPLLGDDRKAPQPPEADEEHKRVPPSL